MPITEVCRSNGISSATFYKWRSKYGVLPVKRNELPQFVMLAKRWIVERSFSWLEKCRRLCKNCERLINISMHMVILAFISLRLKRS